MRSRNLLLCLAAIAALSACKRETPETAAPADPDDLPRHDAFKAAISIPPTSPNCQDPGLR